MHHLYVSLCRIILTFIPLSLPIVCSSPYGSTHLSFSLLWLLCVWIVCTTPGRTSSPEKQLDIVLEIVSLFPLSSAVLWFCRYIRGANNLLVWWMGRYRIASFSGDLSSMTAPPFILSPVSLTEFPGMCPNCHHPLIPQ